MRIRFEGFPSFPFYSNSTLAKDDVHAQRVWADGFWPRTLYYINPPTESLDTNENRFNMAADQSVYPEWLGSILGNSTRLELEYRPVTVEDIRKITPAA